ncbi:MAG: tetratricopeptide repeat protein, partial [Planctomycetes bacterium]|nr:tetratricopeptide repeat protein [Planctomycetota bacterium]
PEQAQVRKIPIDHRTDIYSLGATMYEVLTLRPPLRGKDHQDTLSQIIARDPDPPRKHNPAIPKDLETIVLKCLRKDPRDRYGTAEALGQDLRRFVRGDPIEAKPQSKWELVLRRVARNRLRLLVSSGAAMLVFACVGLAWRLSVETRNVRSRAYERTVFAAAMKLLRGDTVLAGLTGKPGETVSLLPAEYKQILGESGRMAVEEALSDLERAVGSLPKRFEAHYHRGRALLMLGRGAEAIREFDEALRRRPGFAPALVLRAEALGSGEEPIIAGDERGEAWSRARRSMRRGRFEDAASAYGDLIALEESAGELYPGSGTAHLLARGAARLSAGEFDEAMPDFWAARVLSKATWGELLEPDLLLGIAYFLRGNPGDLQRADAHLSGDVNPGASMEERSLWAAAVYSSLVGWCKGLGRLPEAVEAARRVARLRPGDLRARLQLGWALLAALWGREQGRTGADAGEGDQGRALREELLQVSTDALGLERTSAAAHDLMGRALAANGEHERARGFFRRAQEIQASEVYQGRFIMRNMDGRAAAIAASVAVALSGDGKAQEGYFEDMRTMESPVNSSFGEVYPCLSEDGLEMYFGSFRPGRGQADICVAWRSDRTASWAGVRALDEINTTDNDTGPSLSADGLELYFSSRGLGGAGGADIFVARRTRRWDDEGNPVPFGTPENVVAVNSSSYDYSPEISHDGLEFFFASERPGGRGWADLYVASRAGTDEDFGEPRPLVNLNTGGNECNQRLSADDRTLFYGSGGKEGGSVMMATRETPGSEFVNATPLGPPVNALNLYAGGQAEVSADWPADGAILYLVGLPSSSWPPVIYKATWRTTVSPVPFRRGDANADGAINISDPVFNINYQFASGAAPSCLKTADANDDGIVDLGDPIFELNYLFASGPVPPAPLAECGADPTADALGCESYPPCK